MRRVSSLLQEAKREVGQHHKAKYWKILSIYRGNLSEGLCSTLFPWYKPGYFNLTSFEKTAYQYCSRVLDQIVATEGRDPDEVVA